MLSSISLRACSCSVSCYFLICLRCVIQLAYVFQGEGCEFPLSVFCLCCGCYLIINHKETQSLSWTEVCLVFCWPEMFSFLRVVDSLGLFRGVVEILNRVVVLLNTHSFIGLLSLLQIQ